MELILSLSTIGFLLLGSKMVLKKENRSFLTVLDFSVRASLYDFFPFFFFSLAKYLFYLVFQNSLESTYFIIRGSGN